MIAGRKTGNKMNYSYTDENRIGDHIWYISDVRKFQSHYPEWEIAEKNKKQPIFTRH